MRLIADWVVPDHRGYAYGVRQALDNIGCRYRPALRHPAAAALYDGDVAAVLWWAMVPAVHLCAGDVAGGAGARGDGAAHQAPVSLAPAMN